MFQFPLWTIYLCSVYYDVHLNYLFLKPVMFLKSMLLAYLVLSPLKQLVEWKKGHILCIPTSIQLKPYALRWSRSVIQQSNASLICPCVGNPNKSSFNSFPHLNWPLKHVKRHWVQSESINIGDGVVLYEHARKYFWKKSHDWLRCHAQPHMDQLADMYCWLMVGNLT